MEINNNKKIFKTPPEEHKRQPADASSTPRLQAGAGSLTRGSRYFRKKILIVLVFRLDCPGRELMWSQVITGDFS